MTSEIKIKSYVLDKYYVSTVLREYETMEGTSKGYETMVAEWFGGGRELGEIMYLEVGGVTKHCELIERLVQGKPLVDEEGEE